MKIFQKISNLVFGIEKGIVAVLLFIVFVSLTSGVIFRYFFNSPLHWTEETAMYSLAWITFVGGSMTIKKQQSAAVSILVEKFTGYTYFALLTICNLIVFLFCIFILILSIKWVSSPYILFEKSSAMQLPMIYPYLSVPVGFLFMTIHSLAIMLKDIVEEWKVLKNPVKLGQKAKADKAQRISEEGVG